MRVRRLRRLGLIGGEPSVTAPVVPDCPITENNPSLQQDDLKASSKVIIDHDIDSDNDDQHKQKQLKIDESYDTCQSSVTVLNIHNKNTISDEMNEGTIEAPKPVANLAQRSRLLAEFEKQHNESKANQTVAPMKSVNVSMETDDINFTSDKPGDGDSGIENMETDEVPALVSEDRTKTVIQEVDEKAKHSEIEICLSRILDAFWADHCEGQIIVSDAAEFYKDFINNKTDSINYDDLAFQIILEIITQYFEGKRIDFKKNPDNHTSTLIRQKTDCGNTLLSNETIHMDTTDINCGVPSMAPHNLPDQGACSYLIECYIRCCSEHDRYNGVKNLKKFGNSVLAVIYSLRTQIVRSAILILNGSIRNVSTPSPKAHRSVLLDLLYEDAIPSDFLRHITEEAYQEPENMQKIFGTLVNNLFTDMQTRVMGKKIDIAPITALYQLSNITIINSADSSVARPFCNLIAKIKNFSPPLCTGTPGREIAKGSYMGPFLSVSVFSEENPKLLEDDDDDVKSNLGVGLQLVSD